MNFSGLSLRDLEYVVAIADHGSFVRAAEHCRVAQPSLSAQVRKLESWIGGGGGAFGYDGATIGKAIWRIVAPCRHIDSRPVPVPENPGSTSSRLPKARPYSW